MTERKIIDPDIEGMTHIGQYIRKNVIPEGMSDWEIAGRFGTGRRALANLLNGRARLSRRMALALSQEFKTDHHILLDAQAELASRSGDDDNQGGLPDAFVPTVCDIWWPKVERWASDGEDGSRLGTLVRRLALATCKEGTRAEFPGSGGRGSLGPHRIH